MLTLIRFAPMAAYCSMVFAFMPSMVETMVITAAMPMKIERMVRALRPFLPQMERHAILNACPMFNTNPPPVGDPQ